MNSDTIRAKADSFLMAGTVRIVTIRYEMKRTRLTTWMSKRAGDNVDEDNP
jgi:hypothetical protein